MHDEDGERIVAPLGEVKKDSKTFHLDRLRYYSEKQIVKYYIYAEKGNKPREKEKPSDD